MQHAPLVVFVLVSVTIVIGAVWLIIEDFRREDEDYE